MSKEMTFCIAERQADLRRRDDAADRPGFHHRDRPLGRDLRRHHAAVRAHDREVAAEADLAEARFQASDIAADFRADIGVDHRRRHPLELAIFAQDVVREREIGVRQRLADHLAGDALVVGIDVGVQEAHRDRLDAFCGQHPASVLDAGAVERRMHLAGGQHAFIRFAASAGATPAGGACGTGGCRPPADCRGR